jgi:hypothetical protein
VLAGGKCWQVRRGAKAGAWRHRSRGYRAAVTLRLPLFLAIATALAAPNTAVGQPVPVADPGFLPPSRAAADLKLFEQEALLCDIGFPHACWAAYRSLADKGAALGARYRAGCDAGALGDCVRVAYFAARAAPDVRARLVRACDGGIGAGCLVLGDFATLAAESGRSTSPPPREAAAAYERACRSNHLRACIELAEMFVDGFGVELSLESATAILQPWCAAGHEKACAAQRDVRCAAQGKGPACGTTPASPDAPRPLVWVATEDAAFARAKREHRGVLVELYDDGSAASRVQASELRRRAIAAKIDFVGVRIDVTRPGAVRDAVMKRLDIAAPGIVFFRPDRKEVSRVVRLKRGEALVAAVPWIAP